MLSEVLADDDWYDPGRDTAIRYHDWYDPGRDAAIRYPDWVIRHRDLQGIPEALDYRRRVILLDKFQPPEGKRSSLAHAIAHIDLGHRWFPNQLAEAIEERQANRLAAERLITFDRLCAAFCWASHIGEVADELDVDIPMAQCRIDSLDEADSSTLYELLYRANNGS